ncbi:serine hydrolase [Herbiconiux sp. A18JL235]|uniref:Serine hydrolase n=1 Tax=Herbiconiux sp. A18JL235 TaxID=3152363 RepID=A0AB39BIU7_9MICO
MSDEIFDQSPTTTLRGDRGAARDRPTRRRRAGRVGASAAARSAAATATAAALALTLAACTPAGSTDPGAAASATAVAASEVELPAGALGEQAAWVLKAINGDITEKDQRADVEARFAPEALESISPDELVAVFGQLGAQAPWVPTAVEALGTQAVITITPASGDALDMQLALDAEDRLAGLLFTPVAADRVPAASWQELEDAVESFAADGRLVVTEVTSPTDERVVSASGLAADEPMPSGSMFKLYVLGAVAQTVADGGITWETPLAITDDVKSLPSGELQNEPSGTEVTVRDAAEKMIAISDNTATDLLIEAVGPDAVRQAFTELGHHDPSEADPLLTTRGLFQLGWGEGAAETAGRDAWNDADSSERQALLDSLPGGLPDVKASAVTTPVWQYGLDWFTTADDLTAVHLGLQQLAETEAGAPVREILAVNPGLGADALGDDWSYVAFKGGSSVGVLAGSWYLEREDGRAFTISIQGRSDDPAELADQATFFGQVQDAVALLAAE